MQTEKVKIGKETVYSRRCRTFSDFWSSVDVPSEISESERSSRNKGSDRFNSCKTFEEAVDKIEKGDPERLKKVFPVMERLTNRIQREIQKAEERMHYSGHKFNSDRYYKGQSKFMHKVDLTETPDRSIRLYVHGTASWVIEPHLINNRGSAILAYAQALESLGYAVEINILNPIGCGNYSILYENTIKRQGEQFDFDRLAFCLCDADFFRRFVFSKMETEDLSIRDRFGISKEGGYGHYCEPPKELIDEYNKKGMYFEGLQKNDSQKNFETEEKAVDYIIKLLVDNKYIKPEKV